MKRKTNMGCALIAAPALLALLAAGAADAEHDLRRAAKLHMAGETPAAVAIWKRWAQQGDADAACNLALAHQHGDGVALDYGEALRWYKLAAEQGDKPAQFQIGLMYQNGQGVAADAEEAHRWLTAHLRHHLHHAHSPQMQAWRQ
jgi:TPR repeat protein